MLTRFFYGLGALMVFCIHIRATAVAAPFRVYVSNEISGDISVIDGESLTVIATFRAGKRPRRIECATAGKNLLVAQSGSPRRGPGADPQRAHDAKAEESADGVLVLDLPTGSLMRKLAVGSDPEEFALGTEGETLYVANEDTSELSAWNWKNGSNVRHCRVSEESEGVTVHPNRREVFVS